MEKAKIPHIDIGNVSSLQEQALEGLKEDAKVYEAIKGLGLSKLQVKENLAVLIDYQDDLHYCDHCPGFDSCDKAQPHYCLKLAFDGYEVKRQVEACPLLKQRQDYVSKFIYHDFPDDWQDKNLRSIDKSAKRNAAIVEFTKIVKGKSNRWIYLTAKARSGKSFILTCFANTYSSLKTTPIAYCVTGNLIEELKSLSFSKQYDAKELFDKKISGLERCPLLILDDFGSEFVSDYTFSSILFPILLARAKAGLLTCFSSDYSIDDVVKMYGEKISGIKLRQFKKFLKDRTQGEIDVSGLELY